MPVAILFFGPLVDIISIGSILLLTGALLAIVGVLYQLASKRAGA